MVGEIRRPYQPWTSQFPFVNTSSRLLKLLTSNESCKMTAKIISMIVIVFFVVSSAHSSSGLKGDRNAICYKAKSNKVPGDSTMHNRPRGGLRQLTKQTQILQEESETFLRSQRTPENQPTRIQPLNIAKQVTEMTCCAGYENENGTCKPQCSPKCENGNCVRLNKCMCNENWRGYSCNETLLCIIVQPVFANVSEAVSERPINGNINSAAENVEIKFKRFPKCRSECLSECHTQVNNKDVKITSWANVTYCLIPMESSCHTISAYWVFLKKNRYAIGGGGLGIVLLMVIICVVCLVRTKRKTRIPMEDIPLETKYPDYMVDNTIYA